VSALLRVGVWRVFCGVLAVATAAVLQLGADDLSHPERHANTALGTLQLAHWCFSAALVLMLVAAALIFVSRNLGGAAVAWFAIAGAGLCFYVGGFNLAQSVAPFTAAGAPLAMVLGLAGWCAFLGLLVLELRRAAGRERGYRQFT
jgi:hypothetical protein